MHVKKNIWAFDEAPDDGEIYEQLAWDLPCHRERNVRLTLRPQRRYGFNR
jgi:hypothetical protein